MSLCPHCPNEVLGVRAGSDGWLELSCARCSYVRYEQPHGEPEDMAEESEEAEIDWNLLAG